MAQPGPPPVVEDKGPTTAMGSSAPTSAPTATTPTPVADDVRPLTRPQRLEVSVGVDHMETGFNPHLEANNTQIVHDIAGLVLPSAFRGNSIDTNVLEDARVVEAPEGVALRIRYTIARAAQWSDGTPITGADFAYLWRGMTSTAGVEDPAGYLAIDDINTSAGGQVVTVDFNTHVERWDLLFQNLLPSHLLGEVDFGTALRDGIPASGGRFLLNNVDRARGVITLNRNDRFWGKDPAKVDIVTLQEVGNLTQAMGMLRSGQVGFVDIVPEQTTQEALELLPEAQVDMVSKPRQLRVKLLLSNRQARAEMAGALDVDQVARLATGRASALAVPYGGQLFAPQGTGLLSLQGRPLVIGVDPVDETAAMAADVIADQLRVQGIEAVVERQRLETIETELIPARRVDAVVTWESTEVTPFAVADLFLCEEKFNRRWCPDNAQDIMADILSGRISPEEALDIIRGFNREEALYVPLLDETRVHVLGRGILGASDSVVDWGKGLGAAASWEPDKQAKVEK
ncbi:ABC transporter family substrate-binding protein [Corynebacterium phocae]|uniref:ABC transporter family substrate-binding protein n=1 Tax=Corynebacterium phocae TaxID=161895 RepID=UPI001FE5DC4B|nr:ABC transporter family substrate-binding protein [Corynebacterium phocae]